MEELYEHQKRFLEEMPARHLCCWEMGTAKTRTAIEWSKKLGIKPLIVIPKGLVKAWQRECKKWGLDSYTLITKEKFRAMVDTLPRHEAVIIDEAHYFAGKSLMNKTMQAYILKHQPKYVLALTGTPYMRNAWNVYRIGLLLSADRRFDLKSIWTWRWFDVNFFTRVRMGYRIIPVQRTDVTTKKALAQLVNCIGSTKRLDECADVPISQEYPEYVEMTDAQEEFLRDMTDIEPIVRYTKSQQAMGGMVKGDAYSVAHEIQSNKTDRLIELAGQNDKLIVVCRYIHELELLEKKLAAAGRNTFVIHGNVPNRDAIIQAARQADDAVLLVGAQLSEGWEAPEFETMVFYSHSFSLKDYVQMKGRIQRINNLKPRCYVHLLVEGSVDKEVYDSLMNKEDFLSHIYAKERSRNNHTTP